MSGDGSKRRPPLTESVREVLEGEFQTSMILKTSMTGGSKNIFLSRRNVNSTRCTRYPLLHAFSFLPGRAVLGTNSSCLPPVFILYAHRPRHWRPGPLRPAVLQDGQRHRGDRVLNGQGGWRLPFRPHRRRGENLTGTFSLRICCPVPVHSYRQQQQQRGHRQNQQKQQRQPDHAGKRFLPDVRPQHRHRTNISLGLANQPPRCPPLARLAFLLPLLL